METIETINWLKKNNLFDLANKTSAIIKNIFIPCLAIKDEPILIIGDKGFKNNKISAVLSASYYLAAMSLNLDAKLVLQGVKSRGQISDNDVIESLRNIKENSIVFINSSDKLGSIKDLGKSFRKFCEKKKLRYISTPSLGDLHINKLGAIIETLNINYKPLQLQHQKIKSILDKGKELLIKTDLGTELYYNINSIEARSADGNYTMPGTGGNLPAGEVYIAPYGKRVEGKVVIDGSSRNHTHTAIVNNPITLKIEEGTITEITGSKEADLLNNTLDWAEKKAKYPQRIRRIGEFGIGLNPKASIIGATIIDEKTLGTAHIGIGSNYWFGGNIFTIIHLDQIFKNPKIYVDNDLLEI